MTQFIGVQYIRPLTSASRSRNERFRDRRPQQEPRDDKPKEDNSAEPAHRVDITV